MIQALLKDHHHQSHLEEIFNSIIHGLGILLSIAALVVLVVMAALYSDAMTTVSVAIYGCTLVVMYTASTIYHAIRNEKAKRIFKIIDHSAIYGLIAGTYTPFTLVTINGPWGWTLFGVIWGLAILGLLFKLFFTGKYEIISVIIYVCMGWLALIAIEPIYDALPLGGFIWLLVGGLCYTIGVIFYVVDHKIHLTHAIWHAFVLAGSICHFFAVLLYVVLR